jgi:cardiolipin synthase
MTLEGLFVILAHAVMAPTAVVHALLYKRDSRSALGWIGFCIVFPLLGPLIYALFGVNRVRTRAQRLHPQDFQPQLFDYERGDPLTLSRHEQPGQAHVGYRVTGQIPHTGNDVSILHNGEQTYPAMLEAMEQAEHRVFLCTYIFDTDTVGRQFIDKLASLHRKGIDVRVIVDGVGEMYSRPRASKLLAEAGVWVERFIPLKLFPPSLSFNLRTHRKILVIDGHTAFTGGMNIGDRHMAKAEDNPDRVVDIHFCLRGPIARDLEALFLDDWNFLAGGQDTISRQIPATLGSISCRRISDGPNRDLDRLAMLYQGMISSARRRVYIMTPYFLPERELAGSLRAAVTRGVDVKILLPGKNNLPLMHWASRHGLWELLYWGVQAYYQPPPFVHSKLLLIDDDYTLIGSANVDARSLRLNFELGVEIFSGEINLALSRHFEQALADSSEIKLQTLMERPFLQRIRDASAALFSPYL